MGVYDRISAYQSSANENVINDMDDITNKRNVNKNLTFFCLFFSRVTSRGKVHTSKLVAFVCCEYLHAQLMRMKERGAWKQFHSEKKSVPLPAEVPGAWPGERLEWRRAIPTEIDPWSRPWSYWNRPWKQVAHESFAKG